ncbi:MAG TPA: hypothetical protein PLQ76_05805 [bacterium]|nr:hypothetical protein [bacterium]
MKKKMIVLFIAVLTVLSAGAPVFAVLPDKRGPTEVVAPENDPEMTELFRVSFENRTGGAIEYFKSDGTERRRLGTVLLPAGAVNKTGYTASGWATVGRVAATAVNAVHVKVAQNGEKGVTLSFMPKEFYTPPKEYNSYFVQSASIITDIPAGEGFFGGQESPFIGCPVLVSRNGSAAERITTDYSPAEGDVLTIVVQRPKKYPSEIEFENRFGGFVTLRYPDGESKIISQVLKPVYGVGRFEGSMYTDVGRIRANHTGVICISTSPVGKIGGFQIIPDNHGMSAEMKNARLLTQWMVIGPPSVFDPSLEGTAPFFNYFIRPVYYKMGAEGRSMDEIMSAFIVQVRLNGGEWQRMPSVTGRVDDGLQTLTHVRILFPLKWFE